MWEIVKKHLATQITIAIFIIFTLWWLILELAPGITDSDNQLFAATYGLMALWGGIWGIIISRKWGGLKSTLGKAIAMFALGLFAQEYGQLAYSYYIYDLKIAVPYPSFGDIGFFGSIIFYICAVLFLAKASGAKIKLQSFAHRIQVILIPLGMLIIAYTLFLQGYVFDWTTPTKIFLDFGYPVGQAIYVSIAFLTYLLSRKILGGVMKGKILFILFALCVQFLSDYIFLYQSSRGTWVVGGVNDYMYLVSYFLMTLAILRLGTVLSEIRK
jgi:hypothetical protein